MNKKRIEILVRIPIGEESEFLTYKRVAKELGIKSLNMHIYHLIKADREKLFSIIQCVAENKNKGD